LSNLTSPDIILNLFLAILISSFVDHSSSVEDQVKSVEESKQSVVVKIITNNVISRLQAARMDSALAMSARGTAPSDFVSSSVSPVPKGLNSRPAEPHSVRAVFRQTAARVHAALTKFYKSSTFWWMTMSMALLSSALQFNDHPNNPIDNEFEKVGRGTY
jgi:hypothetical protein